VGGRRRLLLATCCLLCLAARTTRSGGVTCGDAGAAGGHISVQQYVLVLVLVLVTQGGAGGAAALTLPPNPDMDMDPEPREHYVCDARRSRGGEHWSRNILHLFWDPMQYTRVPLCR